MMKPHCGRRDCRALAADEMRQGEELTRLREALERIVTCTGTSSEAHHFARAALGRPVPGSTVTPRGKEGDRC
jgi:hypothetical protein